MAKAYVVLYTRKEQQSHITNEKERIRIMANININNVLQELADYTRMENELTAQIESLKDQVKAYMAENDLTELLGDHGEKVHWKPVVSKRFDTTAFKKSEWAELYEEYCKPSETRPFKFYA